MDEIRWGIIGCGDVAERKSGPAFQQLENSQLIAVMRRNAQKAADFAERHQVSKWYTDAEKLINDPEVNSLYVATPPNSHAEYAMAALAAGKHVYLEKPMAMDSEAATRIKEKAETSSGRLVIAHYRRELPAFKFVKDLLEKGSIGKPLYIDLKVVQPIQSAIVASSEVNWRVDPAISGGGLFHDLAPHQLDLMVHYFGAVEEMKGLSANQLKITEADDLVSGLIHFQNGVFFRGLWSFSSFPGNEVDYCEITGSKGKVEFSFFGKPEVLLVQEGKREIFRFEQPTFVQQPMIEKVVGYFLGRNPNPCPAEEAVEVMRLMDAFTGTSK